MKAGRSLYFSGRVLHQPFYLETANVIPRVARHHYQKLPGATVLGESRAAPNELIVLAYTSTKIDRVSNIVTQVRLSDLLQNVAKMLVLFCLFVVFVAFCELSFSVRVGCKRSVV